MSEPCGASIATHMLYRNLAATEAVAVAIGITFLAYARAGSALGIRNFFLEVHPDPDNAPSDGPNMLRLDDFEKVVRDIVAISEVVQ